MTAVVEAARELPDLSCITLSVASAEERAQHFYLGLAFGVEPRALRIDGRYLKDS